MAATCQQCPGLLWAIHQAQLLGKEKASLPKPFPIPSPRPSPPNISLRNLVWRGDRAEPTAGPGPDLRVGGAQSSASVWNFCCVLFFKKEGLVGVIRARAELATGSKFLGVALLMNFPRVASSRLRSRSSGSQSAQAQRGLGSADCPAGRRRLFL